MHHHRLLRITGFLTSLFLLMGSVWADGLQKWSLAGDLLLQRASQRATPGNGGSSNTLQLPTASRWLVEHVDDPKSFSDMEDRSLVLDAADHPHIVYGREHLYYARFDGAAWHIEIADDSAQVGQYASLALDAAGLPRISYCDSTNGALRYAHYDGSAWHIEVVDSVGSECWHTSLALDSVGRPHIAYYGWSQQVLKYASFDGAAWYTETVTAGYDPSLSLDATDRPHISCDGFYGGGLIYTHFDGAAWQTEVVANSGEYESLALDAEGQPCLIDLV